MFHFLPGIQLFVDHGTPEFADQHAALLLVGGLLHLLLDIEHQRLQVIVPVEARDGSRIDARLDRKSVV